MYLFLCLEYSIGGEFFSHLRKAQRFPDETSKFYAAGVALVRYLVLHALIGSVKHQGGETIVGGEGREGFRRVQDLTPAASGVAWYGGRVRGSRCSSICTG